MNADGWTPDKLLELSGNYWAACALHAAIKLEVFSVIGEQALNAGAVAGDITADVRGMEMLLNALAALGLLTHAGGRYSNTPFGLSCLVKASPRYLGFMIMHHHHLLGAWARMAESIRGEAPSGGLDLHHDASHLESFLMGMFNIASSVAPRVVSEVDLSACRQLLDLGGGPGTYAIHFCLHNPQLSATVFDQPGSRSFAEATIDRYDLAHRIRFLAGDFNRDDIGGTYDVVWLSHILHSEDTPSCQALLHKAASVLQPGGMFLVHDFILDDSLDRPLYPALFSLNMFLNTAAGQSYSGRQIMEMLAAAGIGGLRRLPFRGPNDSGIIYGIKGG